MTSGALAEARGTVKLASDSVLATADDPQIQAVSRALNIGGFRIETFVQFDADGIPKVRE